MKKLFEDIIISSPNGGGVFFSDGKQVYRIDSLDTTGLSFQGNTVARCVQPNTVCICGNRSDQVSGICINFEDVHDILLVEDYYYIVGTAENEIIKLNREGQVLQRSVQEYICFTIGYFT
jgi:hypothetical protein